MTASHQASPHRAAILSKSFALSPLDTRACSSPLQDRANQPGGSTPRQTNVTSHIVEKVSVQVSQLRTFYL